jgi:hypothetical protein
MINSSEHGFDTPVLMLVFNRPDNTQKVFDALKQRQPRFLYVVADGARAHKSGESERVEAVRQIFLTQIDWDCELKTLFRPQNMGCRDSVSSGISWFFEQVTEGIILEDDCIPHPDFFIFCREILSQHRDNPKVMCIGGSQFLPTAAPAQQAYHYTHIPYTWGWATWRRAWNLYDVNASKIKPFAENPANPLSQNMPAFIAKKLLLKIENSGKKIIDTWDYQWLFTLLLNEGYSICPTRNLIQNIGFDPNASNFTYQTQYMNLPTYPLPQPFEHPPVPTRLDWAYDRQAHELFFGKNLFERLVRYIRTKIGR